MYVSHNLSNFAIEMIKRYFIYLSFDGTAYHGWQIQPNAVTVQQVLQDRLSVLLRMDIDVVGAGRTDTGVHARLMVAHFDYDGYLDGNQLTYKLNRMMPRDIAIHEIKEVDTDLHARFSAVSRTYHYYIHTSRNPFKRFYSLEMSYQLDFDAMNKAAESLLDVHDFGAFCKAGADTKTTICNLTRAVWIELEEPGCWCFEITANRFLRNMVRAVTGTLIEVGRGRMSLNEFRNVVASGSRQNAGESMPAHALFLWDIVY